MHSSAPSYATTVSRCFKPLVLTAALVLHLDVPFTLRAERSLALYGSFGAEARQEL